MASTVSRRMNTPGDDPAQVFGADHASVMSRDSVKSHKTSQSAFSHSVYSQSEFMNAPVQSGGGPGFFFRRMPCKARGVPGEHVAKNAYVDIPLNAKHGTVLSCSHPACRLSGRLFRFCAVCQVPVAKRNFARRHTHGLSLSQIASSNEAPVVPMEPVRSGNNDALPPPAATSSIAGESSLPPTPVKSSMEGNELSGASVLVPGNISVHAINQHHHQQNGGGGAHLKNGTGARIQCHSKRKLDESTTLQVSPDELDWLYLFRQRPGPKDSKEAWLRRLEKVAGFSIKGEQQQQQQQQGPSKKIPRQGSEDAAVLPEIEAPVEGLANFDAENLEDLFE